jgi:hypothetical protein
MLPFSGFERNLCTMKDWKQELWAALFYTLATPTFRYHLPISKAYP